MGSDETIRLSRAFCSARDRNVPVLRDEAGGASAASAASDGTAGFDDLPRLVSCLDYGVRCTGWLCPLFTLPTLPPEELLAEAVQAERDRKTRAVTEGTAILERALREGRIRNEREARRSAASEQLDAPSPGTTPSDPPAGPLPTA
jgi:hypothetical protein